MAISGKKGKDGYWLTPNNCKPRPIPHFLAFDCETNGTDEYDEETKTAPGEMKCACVYGEYKLYDKVHKVDLTFTNRDDLTAFFKGLTNSKGNGVVTQIVGYNLAFDMWYVFDGIDYDTMITVGSRIIKAELDNGITMFDLWNHSGQVALEEWFEKLNLKEKGLIKTDHPELMKMPELIEHCKADTRATWEVAEYFKQMYNDMGVSFKLTTSAVAMNLFVRKFHWQTWGRSDEKQKSGMSMNEMERLAYYGGRVEVFSRGVFNIQSYDVNSMYVSAMRDGLLPVPNESYCEYRTHGFEHYFYAKDIKPNLMIIHCRVKAPKSRVMVLPYRDPVNDKLIFPWGEFSGWWTSPELKEALKYGYTIEKVYEYILYRKPMYILKDYANFCYGNRMIAKGEGDEGMSSIWKLMGNGLYGKFGQRNDVSSGFASTAPLGQEGQNIMPVSAYGKDMFVISGIEKKDSGTSFPCISAFITSYARLKILRYLKANENNVVYCDTDSIKYPDYDIEPDPHSKRHVTSKELGDMKFEPEHSGLYLFLKCKLYGKVPLDGLNIPQGYDWIKPLNTMLKISANGWKIKGVGKSCEELLINLSKMCMTGISRRPSKLKESLRRGGLPNVWHDVEKTMTIIDDKRLWKEGTNDSEPLYVFEEPL